MSKERKYPDYKAKHEYAKNLLDSLSKPAPEMHEIPTLGWYWKRCVCRRWYKIKGISGKSYYKKGKNNE